MKKLADSLALAPVQLSSDQALAFMTASRQREGLEMAADVAINKKSRALDAEKKAIRERIVALDKDLELLDGQLTEIRKAEIEQLYDSRITTAYNTYLSLVAPDDEPMTPTYQVNRGYGARSAWSLDPVKVIISYGHRSIDRVITPGPVYREFLTRYNDVAATIKALHAEIEALSLTQGEILSRRSEFVDRIREKELLSDPAAAAALAQFESLLGL